MRSEPQVLSKSWRSKSGSFWWSWFWTPCNNAGMFSCAWVKFSKLELQVKSTAFSFFSLLKKNIWVYITVGNIRFLDYHFHLQQIPESKGYPTFIRHAVKHAIFTMIHDNVGFYITTEQYTLLLCVLCFLGSFLTPSFLFFFLYFTSADTISFKICLKFMVVGWRLIKACQCDAVFHSWDMQEDDNLFWNKN